jgi:hypothetical protein
MLGLIDDDLRRIETHGLAVQQGAVVFGWIVELQPGGTIGGLGQSRRMGLAEAELCKAGDLLKGHAGHCIIYAIPPGAFHELVPQPLHSFS